MAMRLWRIDGLIEVVIIVVYWLVLASFDMVQASKLLYFLPSDESLTVGNDNSTVFVDNNLGSILKGRDSVEFNGNDTFGLTFLKDQHSQMMVELYNGERMFPFDKNLCNFVS